MNLSTSAAMVAANVALQNAMRNSSSSGGGTAFDAEAPVVIATVCLLIIAGIVGAFIIQFMLDHPVVGIVILIAIIIFCAMWYGACY